MINARKQPSHGTSVALRVAAGAPVPADVAARLHTGGRAIEVDCGGGLGCLALAEAFPAARVVGHDRDPSEIARAQALARASGLDGRVTFEVAGSTRLERAAFDLAAVRAVSNRADALQVLNAIRNALAPGGVCLLVEPARAGADEAPFAGSARGRDARARNLSTLARQAGFASCEQTCGEPAVDVYELRR
jgi:predicted O-methyltransferase YrrM